MEKCFFNTIIIFLLCVTPCNAGILENIWDTYTSSIPDKIIAKEKIESSNKNSFLGRIVGNFSVQDNAFIKIPWKYSAQTYELFFEKQTELTPLIYGLALHAGDIDSTMSREKFIRGVLGFHYTVDQICAWINDAWAEKSPALTTEEYILVGILLQDGIINFKNKQFVSTGLVSHIIGVSSGKKKKLQEIVEHERAHVSWDEDSDFRLHSQKQWGKLSDTEKAAARKKLYRYAQGNEAQLIEEWAVHEQ